MPCGALCNTTSDESFYSDVLSEIDFMYSLKDEKIKTPKVSSVMENSSKMNEEKFGVFQLFSVGALYRSRELREYL